MRPALTLCSMAALVLGCSTPETARETQSQADAATADEPEADAHARTQGDAPAGADATAAALPPITPSLGADDPPPNLDEVGRWFEAAPLAAALDLWRSGERARAAAALDDFAAQHPRDARALPARFMAAWILAEGEPEPTVASRFESLALDWPAFADVCHYHAALAHMAEVELAQARAAAQRIPTTSTHWGPAQALLGRTLDEEGQPAQARAVLEAAVKAAPDALPPDAWERLEGLRERADDPEGAGRARLELATRFPASEAGKAALGRITYKRLAAAERLRLAEALLDAGRPDTTRAVLVGLTRPKDVACAAWVLVGRAWEKKKKDKSAAANAWKSYKKALACEGPARGDATFLGGRNRLRNDDAKTGLKLLAEHAQHFPERTTADDALRMVAEAKTRPKDVDKALVKTLSLYPSGDQADEVAWQLVQRPLGERDWKAVKRAIDKILDVTQGRPPSRHGGRYHYWKGRAEWELGERDAARATWRELVTREPLTWYTTLALSRLAAEDPTAASLVAGHAPASPAVPDDRVASATWADPHFRRALEWARLAGPAVDATLGVEAFQGYLAAELAAVDRRARGEGWAWTQVALWELAGDHARAMRIARSEEASGAMPWPTRGTAAARLWRLAYPRPFARLVALWATTRAIAAPWIWSIARVESNFQPTAVSWANAIGLMQIIPSTAAFLAKDTTIDPTREALMRPEVALELGSKYLARLLAKHELYPLASAGYNAGGGAVSRWRREFGDLELDEFVERIPYREANNYAKSVTQTLARYLWLYDGEVLVLPLAAPGLPKDPTPTEGPTPSETSADGAAEPPAEATPAAEEAAPEAAAPAATPSATATESGPK